MHQNTALKLRSGDNPLNYILRYNLLARFLLFSSVYIIALHSAVGWMIKTENYKSNIHI